MWRYQTVQALGQVITHVTHNSGHSVEILKIDCQNFSSLPKVKTKDELLLMLNKIKIDENGKSVTSKSDVNVEDCQ